MNRSPADGIYVVNVASRKVRALVPSPHDTAFPIAWSPDGKQLLYHRISGIPACHDLWVVDAQSGAARADY